MKSIKENTIKDLFLKNYTSKPNDNALVIDDKKFTYKELYDLIHNLAQNFRKLGINKGDRVAIILPNCKEFVITYFALFEMGAWAMPVNTRWEEDEIKNVFNDAKPKAVVYKSKIGVIHFHEIITKIKEKQPYLNSIINIDNIDYSIDGSYQYEKLFETPKEKFSYVSITPDDIAMLSYTSGTTGVPKGVLISHNNFVYTSIYSANIWKMQDEYPLSIAPLYAAQGFLAMLIDLASGGPMHFLSTFNPNDILKTISQGKVTVFHTQPTMWTLLLNSKLMNFANFSSLNKVVVSGSICAPELAKRIENTVGCRLLNAYGLIEGTSVATLTHLEDSTDIRLNTVGKPIPGASIRIVDENKNDLEKGETGELAMKGYLMKGYYNREDKTKEVIDEDGWLYTGDLAKYFDDENISIVGRCKDMIIRGAFNIYPVDIENVILSHPRIQDVAVVGRDHDVIGEQTVAFVVPKPGEKMTKNDIIRYCTGKIANYKIPDDVIFISQMPIILAGKIEKKLLTQWANKGVPDKELFLFE